MNQSAVHGILAIDKPPGVTSRRVVDAVSHTLKTKAVGHAGTLDPLASGVVVVCVGNARKLVDFIHQQEKAYTVSFLLGRSSPSDDFETDVTWERKPYRPSLEEIERSLGNQRGTILQIPCSYSAKRVAGKRAYKLARLGKEVILQPKEIHVSHLEITAYEWPRLELSLVCSSGTFVRALGRDIAKSAGTCAVMETLIRTAVGPYLLDAAIPFSGITMDDTGQRFIEAALHQPASALPHLQKRTLSAIEIEHAARGGHLPGQEGTTCDTMAALDENGELLGILRVLAQGGWRLRPNFIDTSPQTG